MHTGKFLRLLPPAGKHKAKSGQLQPKFYNCVYLLWSFFYEQLKYKDMKQNTCSVHLVYTVFTYAK